MTRNFSLFEIMPHPKLHGASVIYVLDFAFELFVLKNLASNKRNLLKSLTSLHNNHKTRRDDLKPTLTSRAPIFAQVWVPY